MHVCMETANKMSAAMSLTYLLTIVTLSFEAGECLQCYICIPEGLAGEVIKSKYADEQSHDLFEANIKGCRFTGAKTDENPRQYNCPYFEESACITMRHESGWKALFCKRMSPKEDMGCHNITFVSLGIVNSCSCTDDDCNKPFTRNTSSESQKDKATCSLTIALIALILIHFCS